MEILSKYIGVKMMANNSGRPHIPKKTQEHLWLRGDVNLEDVTRFSTKTT